MNKVFSSTILSMIAIAGLLPITLIIFEPNFNDGTFSAALDAYLLKPWGVIVYAILFGVGTFSAYQTKSAIWAICLVPSLVCALWPLFRHNPVLLPVPTGAIVAFAEKHERATDVEGCPPGWAHYTGLAGRFPIGVGADPGLSRRSLSDETGGREVIELEDVNIPAHSHALTSGTGRDANTQGSEHSYWPTTRVTERLATEDFGRGLPYSHMPPYRVVLFCQFVGSVTVPVVE